MVTCAHVDGFYGGDRDGAEEDKGERQFVGGAHA
jgi:hypothetical protein